MTSQTTEVRVIDGSLARRLLPLKAVADVVRATLAAKASSPIPLVPRVVARPCRQGGVVAAMPAVTPDSKWMGGKLVTVFPANAAQGLPVHRGVVLLCEGANGALVAIVDATVVTQVRTAVLSAVATQQLAAPEVRQASIIGCGEQGGAHVEALHAVCGIGSFRLWNRNYLRAQALARTLEERLEVECIPERDIRQVLAQARVVCTATSSAKPFVPDDAIEDGAHINAIGASTPEHSELADETIARSCLTVDDRESALQLAGDIMRASGRQVPPLQDLGAIIAGRASYKWRPDAVSVFRSVGIGLLDVAVAQALYTRAAQEDAGYLVRL